MPDNVYQKDALGVSDACRCYRASCVGSPSTCLRGFGFQFRHLTARNQYRTYVSFQRSAGDEAYSIFLKLLGFPKTKMISRPCDPFLTVVQKLRTYSMHLFFETDRND